MNPAELATWRVNNAVLLAAVRARYTSCSLAEIQAHAELAQLAERWRIRSQTAGASEKPR